MALGNHHEQLFYSEAKHKLSRKTLEAIERIHSLGEEATFRVQFNLNEGERSEHSMLVFTSTVSDTASLFRIQTGGWLMLMIDKHPSPRVKSLLNTLAESLSWRDYRGDAGVGSASEKLPTIPVGKWEDHVTAILDTARALATPVVPVRAAGPTVHKKSPTQSMAAIASNPSKPTEPRANDSGTLTPQPSSDVISQPPDNARDTQVAMAEDRAPLPPDDEAPLSFTEAEIKRLTSLVPDKAARQMVSRLMRARSSQFRFSLLKAYEHRCCVSDSGPADVLEAAHIDRHAESGDDNISNGLLLRSDLHTLFDAGLLRIRHDSLCVWLHERVRRWYPDLHGKHIRLPQDPRLHPSPEKLRARFATQSSLPIAPGTVSNPNDGSNTA